jgi:hypothetical protein
VAFPRNVVIPGNAVLIGPDAATDEGDGAAGERGPVADDDATADGGAGAPSTSRGSEEDATHQSASPPAATKPISNNGNGTLGLAA